MPTEKGAEFLKYARTVMVQIEKMEMLYRPTNPERQELSVSVARGGYIAQAVTELIVNMNAGREMSVQWRENDSVQVLEDVARGEAAIGVLRYRKRDENYFKDYLSAHGLKGEMVWEFEQLVTFVQTHPLKARMELKSEMFFPYVEVVLKEENLPYIPMRSEERRDDQREEKCVTVNTRRNQLELISQVKGAYMWCEALPEEVLRQYSLLQRACHNEAGWFRDVLIYQQEHEFTHVEKAFIDKLYECRNRQAFRQFS
jgi:DNA-binding transcriptional LysR family regulator